MLRKTGIVIAWILLSPLALRAGWVLEPYLGYETGRHTMKDNADFDASGKTSMTLFGFRGGWAHARGFWITLDALSGFAGKFSYDDPVNGADSKTARMDLGLTAGFDFPRAGRAYLGYVVAPELRMDPGTGTEEKYLGGFGFKIGIGYTLLRNLAINLEYYGSFPKKYEIGDASGDISETFNQFSESGYRFVLSFPMKR